MHTSWFDQVLTDDTEVSRFAISNEAQLQHQSQIGVIEFPKDEPAAIKLLIDYLYNFNYSDVVEGFNPLTINATMFVVGYKYDIPSLRTAASAQFAKRAEIGWNEPAFVDAVRFVYKNTPHAPNAIRAAMVAVSCAHYKALWDGDTGFQAMVGEIKQFYNDVAVRWAEYFSKRSLINMALAIRYAYANPLALISSSCVKLLKDSTFVEVTASFGSSIFPVAWLYS